MKVMPMNDTVKNNMMFIGTVESCNCEMSFFVTSLFLLLWNFYNSECDLWYTVILANINSCLLNRVFLLFRSLLLQDSSVIGML